MNRESALWEREGELAALDRAVLAMLNAEAPVVVVNGPAGIGKSSLLDVAVERAGHVGARVLRARGGVMERDLVFGVAAQLLETTVVSAGDAGRAQLLAGPAVIAAEALRPGGHERPAYESGALNHGLYWLVLNVLDQGPLLLVVDDAHWSDAASLAFLLHLVRRRHGHRLGILLAARSDEAPVRTSLSALLAEAGVEVVEPRALSAKAAADLLCARSGHTVAPPAVQAAHEVTGGNPFFLGEIGAALRGLPADSPGTVGLVRSLVPDAVRHALLLRLGRLGDDALQTAQALAVLGEGAALDHVAAVAGIDREAVLSALSRLAAAGVTAPDAVTRFAHPIVHTAILGDLSAAQRALRHERAARALAASGAETERVAHHLLGAEPAGRPDDAQQLARAGAAALRRGDPETAVGLLARAVAEPPAPSARAEVRFELGRARMAAGDPAGAAADLRAALGDAAADSELRMQIALNLGDALAAADRIDAAIEISTMVGAELEGDAALRLEVHRTTLSLFDPSRAAAAARQMLTFAELPGDTAAERVALANAAIASAFLPDARAVDVIAIARRALSGGRLLADRLMTGVVYAPPIYALLLAGDLEQADRELTHVQAHAQAQGSVVDALINEDLRLELCRQRGELQQAAAHGVAALELAREWGEHAVALRVLSLAVCWLVEVLTEQDKLGLARQIVTELDTRLDLESRPELAWGVQARAIVAAADGRHGDARQDLAHVEVIARSVGYEDRTASWRLPAVRALAATGENERAAELAADELALCRVWGAPGPLAAALRCQAMLGDGPTAEERLHEAWGLVRDSPFTLEAARVATDLGVAQRRSGKRTLARETLAAAADAAVACGAIATAERGRRELVALGARPRRLRLGGVDALTPSEHRVAGLAAAGLSNRQIAQELFVSPKTVESHLGQVYGKLGVSGRNGLASVLAGAAPDAVASAD